MVSRSHRRSRVKVLEETFKSQPEARRTAVLVIFRWRREAAIVALLVASQFKVARLQQELGAMLR